MDLREALEALDAALAEQYPGEFLNVEALKTVVDHVRRQLDPAGALRDLAADLAKDAAEFDVADPLEGGVVTGLGRAAGKAQARAEELDGD